MTRVKICGLTSRSDAELAIRFGADALGFILEPTSPRYLAPEQRGWIERLPTFTMRVAVFGRVPDGPEVAPFHLVQFVERMAPVRDAKLVRAVRVKPGLSVREVIKLSHNVSALCLDAFVPGAYGGTGHTVDWEFAAEVVAECKVPVILAGGLTPENVGEAIAQVRPYAVDVSSGVEERPRVKDPVKLRDFIQAAHQAGRRS